MAEDKPITREEFDEIRAQIADLHGLVTEFLPLIRGLLGNGNGQGPNYLAMATAARRVRKAGK